MIARAFLTGLNAETLARDIPWLAHEKARAMLVTSSMQPGTRAMCPRAEWPKGTSDSLRQREDDEPPRRMESNLDSADTGRRGAATHALDHPQAPPGRLSVAR